MPNLEELKELDGTSKQLKRDYAEDLRQHDGAIDDYDAYEAMDMGKTYDPISRQTGNGLTDNMTSTIYLERAARVAGQLPDGETKAFGKKDLGKGLFADILRKNWMYPNMNSQFDFLTKMYMWQYGSSEYNYMPMYVDLNVAANGYFGPDCWLWSPRNFIPQSGLTSITDMDYAHAIAYKTKTFFTDILEDYDNDDEKDGDEETDSDGYILPAIKKVISQIKEAVRESDPKRDTLSYRKRMTQGVRQIAVVTRYEAGPEGHWITFLPDYGYTVIRDVPNPHKNGRIPFVMKRCIPKFDSFYGNGDFQRSMPMQFANDGLDNYYFQGIKVNLFPINMVNVQTAVRHTINNEAGATWEFNGTPDAKRMETSNAGLSTYQAAKGMSKGAIQSIAGTTDTRSNAADSSDPGFGKTPEALKMIGDREATRDSQDRANLEASITEMMDLMYSILPTISNDIPVDMFSTEIEEIIESGYTDLADIFIHMAEQGHATYRESESGEQLRIKIKPTAFKGINLKFQLKADSTAKKTKEGQLSNLKEFLDMITSLPNALDQFTATTNKTVDWEYVFTEAGKLYDLPFLSKMFMPVPPPTAPAVTTPAGQEPAVPGVPAPAPVDPAAIPAPVAPVQPVAPPVAPPAPVAPPQPPMPTVEQIMAASPQNPVIIMGHQFVSPAMAMEALNMIMQGVPS